MTLFTMTEVQCCECGMDFSMSTRFEQMRRKDGKLFFCPAGHKQYFSNKEEEISRLRKEAKQNKERVDRLLDQRDDLIQKENRLKKSLSATKGLITRTKNRISKGVCPCCNRSFTNLRRHMDSKHPDYTEKKKP